VEVKGELIVCKNGLHLCSKEDLIDWLDAQIFVAEYKGRLIESGNKVFARKVRLIKKIEAWDARAARLFAADCAERVLPIFEEQFPNDSRPREAIAAARSGANAARAADGAAYDAASGAAADAVHAAYRASRAAYRAAYGAAYAAARAADAVDGAAYRAADAADDAAHAADGAAYGFGWEAERAWQTERLFQYLNEEMSDD